jgi:hypothetical protein
MSGVDTELTKLTEGLLQQHGAAQTDAEREDCIRSFVAQVNKRRHTTGEGGEGKKDVMLDLDMSTALVGELVSPAKIGEGAKRWEVKAKLLEPRPAPPDSQQMVLDSPKLVRIGSCVWIKAVILHGEQYEDAGFVILSIEPVWDSKGDEYKLCGVEEAK